MNPFFGASRKLIERIDSLDEKWYVEIWVIKYYLFGIEIYIQKKEIMKHAENDTAKVKTAQ